MATIRTFDLTKDSLLKAAPADKYPAYQGRQHSPVDAPAHYTSHPSGIECITITEHLNFNMGNAIKYVFRADYKGKPMEDLKKARWYIDREITRREALLYGTQPTEPK